MFDMLKLLVTLKSNMTSLPNKRKETVVPVIEAISSGKSDPIVRSIIRTSMAKTIAAMGDLKIAAMAAEEPQAIKSIFVCVFILNNLPIFEPMADPVSTIGASSPTEPPKPTVNVLEIRDEYMLCGLILPLSFEMAYKIRLTPWLILSLIKTRK